MSVSAIRLLEFPVHAHGVENETMRPLARVVGKAGTTVQPFVVLKALVHRAGPSRPREAAQVRHLLVAGRSIFLSGQRR